MIHEANAELIRQLSSTHGWQLSAAQVQQYQAWLSTCLGSPSEQRAKLLENYHADHALVASLIDSTQSSHNAAWEDVNRIVQQALYHCHADRKYQNTAIDIDDLSQIALARINQGLPQFKYASRLTTWIFRITINVFLAMVRSQQAAMRDAPTDSIEQHQHLQNPQDHIYRFLLFKELLLAIRQTLNSAADQRLLAVFQLKVVEDQRLADMSTLLQLSPARICTLLQKAKHLLRENGQLREAASQLGFSLDE